jgi:hypothetical protein
MQVLHDPRTSIALGELAGYRDASWGKPSAANRKALAADWAPMSAYAVDETVDPSTGAPRSAR